MTTTVKYDVPDELKPRICKIAKALGLPADITFVLLMQDGYVTHLRGSIERAEADIARWKEEDGV